MKKNRILSLIELKKLRISILIKDLEEFKNLYEKCFNDIVKSKYEFAKIYDDMQLTFKKRGKQFRQEWDEERQFTLLMNQEEKIDELLKVNSVYEQFGEAFGSIGSTADEDIVKNKERIKKEIIILRSDFTKRIEEKTNKVLEQISIQKKYIQKLDLMLFNN